MPRLVTTRNRRRVVSQLLLPAIYSDLTADRHSCGTGHAGAAEAAVTAGILGEVLLVIVLGVVELRRGAELGGDRPVALCLQGFLVDFLRTGCRLRLRITICIDGGAVLRAGV